MPHPFLHVKKKIITLGATSCNIYIVLEIYCFFSVTLSLCLLSQASREQILRNNGEMGLQTGDYFLQCVR